MVSGSGFGFGGAVEGVVMTNSDAVEETIEALKLAGRIEPIDTARLQAVRSLADAVDTKPFSPGLWQEYRAALSEVLGSDVDADDGIHDALAAIRSAAPMGNPKAS